MIGTVTSAALRSRRRCISLSPRVLKVLSRIKNWLRRSAAVTLTLSEIDVAKVLTYEQLIPAMEKALFEFSAGRVIQPRATLFGSSMVPAAVAVARQKTVA